MFVVAALPSSTSGPKCVCEQETITFDDGMSVAAAILSRACATRDAGMPNRSLVMIAAFVAPSATTSAFAWSGSATAALTLSRDA